MSEAQVESSKELNPPDADVHNMFLRAIPPSRPAQTFPDLPDSQYVYNTVGNALVMALSEVVTKRPADPIEYIAERLKNYRDTEQYCADRDAEFEQIKQMRIKRKEEEERRKAIELEIQAQKELENQRRLEELENKRKTVPLSAVAEPRHEVRDKTGATPLHHAVKNCNVEALLNSLHEGQSFCSRDSQGQSVREIALTNKNDEVVKEIDSLVISWIRENKADYMRWLLASGYSADMPNLKKAFGPKLKSVPEEIRKMIDSITEYESRYRELWKLSAKGTKEHLDAHFAKLGDQYPEDIFSRNRENLSAIHIALLSKNKETVNYLITKFPALLKMEDGFGRLPIHYAYGAGSNFVEIIQSSDGENLEDVKDAHGLTPSVYARKADLLPDVPEFETPDLIVTVDGDDAETPDAETTGGEAEAGTTEEQDQSKLTPINEDEAEET